MATDIGRLAVQMSLNPGAFYQEIEKASVTFRSFGKMVASVGIGGISVGGILSSLPGVFGQIGGAVTALGGSLKAAGDKGIEFMSTVYGFSRQFQLSAASATNLVVAARHLGVETDSVGMAMRKMQMALGHAAGGGVEAQHAFTRLGLDFQQIMALKPDQALGMIGDALNHVGSQSERSALAAAVFGKGWAEIDKLLRGGSAAIAQAQEEVKRFNLSLSQTDIKNLKELKQAGRDAELSLTGLSLSIGRALIPILVMLKDATLGFIEIVRPMFDFLAVLIGVFESVVKFAGGIKTLSAVMSVFGVVLGIVYLRMVITRMGLAGLILMANMTTGAMQALKFALISTGVGLLVVALSSVVGWLMSTSSAAQQAGGSLANLQQIAQSATNAPAALTARGILAARSELAAAQTASEQGGSLNQAGQFSAQERIDRARERIATLERLLAQQQAIPPIDEQAIVDNTRLEHDVQHILNAQGQNVHGAGFAQEGSAAAISAVNQAIARAARGDPNARVEAAINQARRVQERQEEQLRLIREALTGIQPVGIPA